MFNRKPREKSLLFREQPDGYTLIEAYVNGEYLSLNVNLSMVDIVLLIQEADAKKTKPVPRTVAEKKAFEEAFDARIAKERLHRALDDMGDVDDK